MAFEPLNSQDATLFCAQDPQAPLQIGAVSLYGAAALRDEQGHLRIDELRQHFDSRLDRVPRFRQRLVPVPFQYGPPVWVDDVDFDITKHVRFAALPGPGSETRLREFVSRLLEEPLDTDRPLWQVWVVEGVEGDRVAVIPKVSHVMADGIALLDFALSVLDAEPQPVPDQTQPRAMNAAPGPVELLLAAARERALRQVSDARGIAGALVRPDRVVRRATTLVSTAVSRFGAVRAPKLPINGPVGRHRDVAWWGVPMADLRAVQQAHDVSLNDVVLAVVAGGLRSYLARAGASVDEICLRVLVPVSTHGATGDEAIENRFSMIVADLPVSTEDPLDALREIHDEMVRHKQSSQASALSVLFFASDLVPVPLLRALGPVALRHQPFVNLAVTNLPGSAEPLHLLGSRLLELYPLITVTGNIALIIGVLSYAGSLGVGITVDADVITDVEALAADLDRSTRALVDRTRDDAVRTTPTPDRPGSGRDRLSPDGSP